MARLVEVIETPTGEIDEMGREVVIPCYAVEADDYESAKELALNAYREDMERKSAVNNFMADILSALGM